LIPEIRGSPTVVRTGSSDHAQTVLAVPCHRRGTLRCSEEIAVQGYIGTGKAAHVLAARVRSTVQIGEEELRQLRLSLCAGCRGADERCHEQHDHEVEASKLLSIRCSHMSVLSRDRPFENGLNHHSWKSFVRHRFSCSFAGVRSLWYGAG